jgi:hypothetical protein
MTTATSTRSTRNDRRTAATVVAMYIGVLLTTGATVAPYVDRATTHVLANHIRRAYPTYTSDQVERAVTAWLTVLTVLGVLGVVGWVVSIWAVKTHKRWARPIATVMFLTGTSSALAALLIKDSSGDYGLAPLLGWINLLPPVAGVMAVLMLWAAPPALPGVGWKEPRPGSGRRTARKRPDPTSDRSRRRSPSRGRAAR